MYGNDIKLRHAIHYALCIMNYALFPGVVRVRIVSAAVIGAAVAQDAFAVSALCGSSDRTKRIRSAVITAFTFGFFQMLMPVLGWSIGKVGSSMIDGFDNYIAFGVLAFLGVKMIIDSRKGITDNEEQPLNIKKLLALAFATSVDALTVGIVLPASVGVQNFSDLMTAVLVIGSVTFAISLFGYLLGRKFSGINPAAAQIIGGIVLVLLGLKALIFE